VERIEIVRGPASALYGSDAVSGVIQIFSRSGAGPPSGSLTATAGSYGAQEWVGELSGGTSLARYGFSLSRRSTEGILDFNNQFRTTVFSGSVRLQPTDRTWARIATRYSDREFHFPTDDTGEPVDRNAFTFGDELALGLDAGHRLTDRIELRALLSLSELDTGTDDAPDGPADTLGYFGYTSLSDVRRAAADLHVNLDLRPGLVLTVGGEIEEQSERASSESLSEWGPSGGWTEQARSNSGLFSQVVMKVGGIATSLAGRLEDNERFGRIATYQVGTSYTLQPLGLKLRGSLGRAVKEPTFIENFGTGFAIGNPDLDPERSSVWEVGLDQELMEGRLAWAATHFSQTFRDLIQYTFTPPDPNGPNFFNVAKARASGLELSVSGSAGGFGATAAYTYLDTEVLNSGFQEGAGATFVEGERLLRRPKHLWSLGSSYSVADRGSVHAGLRFVGGRTDRDFSQWPANPVELPGYTLLDIGANLTVSTPQGGRPGLTLLLRGENLLDRAYEETFAFPAPGRGVYVGVRVTFGH
jgi:vitamin B12 transporter